MTADRDWRADAGLLLLRLGSGGSLFLIFGIQKLGAAKAHLLDHQPWAFIEFNRRITFPLPTVTAYLQTFNESVLPLLLIAGLWGRIPGSLLRLVFAVATGASVAAHESYLTAATYCVVFLSLGLIGPGSYSVDRWRRRSRRIRPGIPDGRQQPT